MTTPKLVQTDLDIATRDRYVRYLVITKLDDVRKRQNGQFWLQVLSTLLLVALILLNG